MQGLKSVFPLVPGTKKPACMWSDRANWVEPSKIAEGTSYGVPCGAHNGVWVLDLDMKDGKNGLAELTAHADKFDPPLELPETYTVRTPSGGLHMYWEWDSEYHPGNRTGVLPGIDVRSQGGYVVAGGAYRVEVDVAPAPAPAWLMELVRTKNWHADAEPNPVTWTIGPDHEEYAPRGASATEWLGLLPPCISGQGGQAQLWKVALRLSRTYEFSVDDSLALLVPYNSRCVPPWSEDELRRALTRAQTHGTGITGTFSAGFLPEPAKSAEVRTRDSASKWRRTPDPNHVYSFDVGIDIHGGDDKLSTYSQKELTKIFAGAGAGDAWVGVWQHDLFRQRTIAVNPPMKLDAEESGISEGDLWAMQLWCACQGVKSTPDQLRQAIGVAAACASYHPVREYLDELPAKSAEEARDYFSGIASRLWGASPERDAIESAHLMRFAVAAVRRVRLPGTKVDTMLVLQGQQGHNKSRFCAALFGEYFRDQMPSLDSKDASIALEGYWGIEIAEMTAFSKSAESTKKEFLSRCEDKYRPVWSRDTRVFARQCVFVGTTNDDDFLRDPTGARRYDVCEVQREISLELLDRDVFWAAASALESAGVPHYRKVGEGEDSSLRFGAEDAWTSDVLTYCQNCKTPYVTPKDCLKYAVVLGTEKQDDRALNRVRAIMRKHLGPSLMVEIDGRLQRCHKRPAS